MKLQTMKKENFTSSITFLHLSNCNLAPQTIRDLLTFTPKIVDLSLEWAKIKETGVANICSLCSNTLKRLNLTGNQIRDKEKVFKDLAKLKHLERLRLDEMDNFRNINFDEYLDWHVLNDVP